MKQSKKSLDKFKYYVCGGGTGGHINAALSIGSYLKEKGHDVSSVSYTHLTLPTKA